jgi:hypothetical protein
MRKATAGNAQALIVSEQHTSATGQVPHVLDQYGFQCALRCLDGLRHRTQQRQALQAVQQLQRVVG